MKLQELGAQRLPDQAERLIENQFGKRIDFGAVGPKRARGMLEKVQGLLREHRRRTDFHRSEQNPDYLQLVVLEQALAARIAEQTPMPTTATSNTAAVMDPKTRAVMDKVKRGQPLTPDEQQTVNRVALMQKESRKSVVREQSELQQAQVVLAAQDMIDRVQGMLEDISEMQFKDLPALADSIKNDMGTDQATQFQSSASTALNNLLQAMQSGKSELESAQGILTGQAPVVPGTADAGLDQLPTDDTGGEEELDLSLDANLDTEPEEEPEADLGRERR